MILENLAQVRKNIELSKQRRPAEMSDDVKLIAVTKNHDVYAMREAIDNGVKFIGENRIQEAAGKLETLEREVEWNLIGHLQTNKVKQAVRMFDLIHSVDSRHLASEINKAAAAINKIQDVLIQVNVADEESKFGIETTQITEMVDYVLTLSNIRLCGLMTVAPHFADIEAVRPVFRELYKQYTLLKMKNLPKTDIKYLSMGMTNDYQIAIEEGANVVRVGTGIFGPRQY